MTLGMDVWVHRNPGGVRRWRQGIKFLASLVVACVLVPGPMGLRGDGGMLIEAESFAEKGGWVVDAQFVEQMGSPYLLAHGLGRPVANAGTVVPIAKGGRYRAWVRTRDWAPGEWEPPGRFRVAFDGRPLGVEFGTLKGWAWQDGGSVDLQAGQVRVELHDLTGFDGRCDAIYLAPEGESPPPEERGALAAWRDRLAGHPADPPTAGEFDVVIIGGGIAGCGAAMAAAERGLRVALVQDRPVLGGNASSEIRVHTIGTTGYADRHISRINTGHWPNGSPEAVADERRRQATIDAIPEIRQFLCWRAYGVTMDGKRIVGVKARHAESGEARSFRAPAFIDCTGDGSIGFWAGAEWRHGREPRSMYNESRAPEVEDERTMGGTLRYATEKDDEPVAFRGPDWARRFLRCEDFTTGRHPKLEFGGWQWVIEYGGQRNTNADAEEIRDELLRIIWGMWDHAKNHCGKLVDESPLYRLTWVSHVVGKRESRRIIGDHVMTEHDIAKQTLFPDRVSYGGWGIDIHPPGGFYDTEPPATFSHKVKFSVPLRSLYSKDVDNLMMAGRCISVSHAALGATRVMITCGLQGQAAGTAAAFCRRLEAMPRAIAQNHIAALQQQLLKDGCYIIELPNQDPADLARGARATASSVSAPIKIDPPRPNAHTFTCDRAVAFKLGKEGIGKFAVLLHSENPNPTPTRLTLRPAAGPGDFNSTEDLATAETTVPPRSKGWVTFQLDAPVNPGFYYAWLPKKAGLAWALHEEFIPDTGRAYRSGKDGWHPSGETYAFKIDEAVPPAVADSLEAAPPPPADMFAPANAINGFARAIRGAPNSWRPDPSSPGPHWLELDFGKPVTLDTAHVAFQTKEMRANDFRLEASRGDAWETLADIRGNADRRRVIGFPTATASKLRLVILGAEPNMGVCEIRAYREKGE